MTYTLYGTSVSPYVRKVRVALDEKGLPYTLVPINPANPPEEFVARSPLRKMPVLSDSSGAEEVVVPDSSIICDYLENRHPEPSLVPADPVLRARTLWLEEHADAGFVAKTGPAIFRSIVINPLLGREADLEAAQTCMRDDLPGFLDYYESELGTNEFFVGSRLTLADISIASPFVNLGHAGCVVPADRWPNVAAFVERMHARPSFKKSIDDETTFHRPVDLAWI